MRSLKLPIADANTIRDGNNQTLEVDVELGDVRRPGNLQSGMNVVSKFAWVINQLRIQENDYVEYELVEDDGKWIIKIIPGEVVEPEEEEEEGEQDLVWLRQGLRPVGINTFDPLGHWWPEQETDVYLAFAKLEEFTDFTYCRGMSANLARRLGYTWRDGTHKPDAILRHSGTEESHIAEFKIKSADFSNNHHKDDVDVLICWDDDEEDRDVLPTHVVALRTLAHEVADYLLDNPA